MSLSALMDPVGFIADVIAICNALGIKTPAQRAESNQLMSEIKAIQESAFSLSYQVSRSEERINKSIAAAATIEVRSRLPNNLSIRSQVLDSTIKLLLILKQVPARVTFAVVLRYFVGTKPATLGMAGSTTDDIHDMVKSLDRLARSKMGSKRHMTAFIAARCRGRHHLESESMVSAALCCLVTEVLGLPSVGSAESIHSSELAPSNITGNKTVVLLRPEPVEVEKPEFDRLCRIFMVGDTRTGKSSLGNALTQKSTFRTSKGMTGTLHIGCEEIVETISCDQLLTEVYDTPGLNDKDRLDVYYQAAIEDIIVTLQQANALVLTIAVDAGITNSTSRAIEEYKVLFGQEMVNMLIVVLTTNESADKDKCDDLIAYNWDTIAGCIQGIRQANVMCVSLEDLRSQEASYSHTVVKEVLAYCQAMPLTIIHSLSLKYEQIKKSLLERRGEVRAEIVEMCNDGWLAYDALAKSFESAGHSAIADFCVKGFVYKHTNRPRRAMTLVSSGICNLIRKFAIHVDFKVEDGDQIWKRFLRKNHQNSPDAMRMFGDMLVQEGLAVLVKAGKPTMCGTLPIERSYVTVFNPHYQAWKAIVSFVEKIHSEETDIAPDIIEGLRNAYIPNVSARRRRRRRQEGASKNTYA